MSELGSVNPIQRMACAHCRALLPEEILAAGLEGEPISCPTCGGAIRLPGELLERHRRQKNLGRNLDIVG